MLGIPIIVPVAVLPLIPVGKSGTNGVICDNTWGCGHAGIGLTYYGEGYIEVACAGGYVIEAMLFREALRERFLTTI